MQPGDRVADRFEIEREAGAGGMGVVYRARDLTTGASVALKILHGRADPRRFVREGRLLASLEHPGIVGYVAHGTPGGPLFLAMEWVEGESLEERLRQERLTTQQSVAVCGRVAEALGAAHARGVVHRDLKPSNLLLEGRSLDRVRIIDFGLALAVAFATQRSASSGILGTLGYMAPEQARGERAVDARADVFSLGCVLFECLTGARPFEGDDAIAILAKLVFDDPRRVREISPDVPEALDELVTRMLAKDPAARPADGAEVVSALAVIAPTPPPRRPIPRAAAQAESLTRSEQRLVSVLLVAPGPDGAPMTPAPADETFSLGPLAEAVLPFSARVEPLLDGSVVVLLGGGDTATDQAARTAACALALRAAAPGAAIALATGRAELGRRIVGEAIDRASNLLQGLRAEPPPADEVHAVAMDDLTAGLLDARFSWVAAPGGARLLGESELDATRPVLGMPTPFVGREAQMTALEALLAESVTDSIARAVVVSGVPGSGKSRLRHELLRRLRARGEEIEVWSARAEPEAQDSALSLAAQMVRRTAGVQEGEPHERSHAKLRACVGRMLPPEERERVVGFLCELIGAPLLEHGVLLRAARRDAVLLGDQMRRAWLDLLEAECARRPVIVVLEDMHWSASPTSALIEAALRRCAERPLMVLVLARPIGRRASSTATLPPFESLAEQVWTIGRGAQDVIRLGGLPRRASEELVRAVLGEVPEALMDRLVEQADGNPFHLEELMRSAAAGATETPPATILAMIQHRLDALEPESRRVLRAASVFGDSFWEGGLGPLLGESAATEPQRQRLDELVHREVLVRDDQSRFGGEAEYRFRHALLRDAAYAMLTDGDRTLGHRLAADWLERAGATTAMAIARHWQLGGEPARAGPAYARAAEQALEANDLAGALDRVARALGCGGMEGEALAKIRRIEAEACRWLGRTEEAARAAGEALELAPRGSDTWAAAAMELAIASHRLGHRERIAGMGRALERVLRADGPSVAALEAGARIATNLVSAGEYQLGEALLVLVEGANRTSDEAVQARIDLARGVRALHAGRPAEYLERMSTAANAFATIGDQRHECAARSGVAFALLQLGAFAEAEEALHRVLAEAERIGLVHAVATLKQNAGLAAARLGRAEHALRLQDEAVALHRAHGNLRGEGTSRVYLCALRLDAGDADGAEREGRQAVELLAAAPGLRVYALAALARAVAMQPGRGDEASALAFEAISGLDALGSIEEGEALVRLARAETMLASGDHGTARAVIAIARDRLLERGGEILDAARRRTFLEDIPEHARTFELAAAWID